MTDKQIAIIKKAKEVFLKKGLFNTVMDDIAEAAGLTRRTLYRHFETKEDLAFETTILIMKEMNAQSLGIYNGLHGNGIEKLESFLIQLVSSIEKQPSTMKYLGEFDFYFKDEAIGKPQENHMDDFNSTILQSDDMIKSLIVQGVQDGSIHADIDIDLTMATISNVLWAFGQRVAIRANTIEEETGIKGIDMIKNQVNMYIMALKETK